MPLTAVRHVRKMRGGAQAHVWNRAMITGTSSRSGTIPSINSVLVNELLAATFLAYLKVTIPECAVIQVTPSFLAANPEVQLQVGTARAPVEPG
jgi:hypothetical protein